MREIQETNDCGRAETLVGYLYGEAAADERANFEGHLAVCAGCRAELAAFGQVRAAVGEWRAEVLQTAPALALFEVTGGTIHAPARHAASPPSSPPQRSAWAALREFFALSPAWLRISSAAAALMLCALAALAVLNAEVSWDNRVLTFSTGIRAAQPADEVAPAHAPADDQAALAARLSELTAERDSARRELEETRAQLEDSRASNIEDALYEEAASSVIPDTQASPPARRANRAARRGTTGRGGARASRDDEDLPRLLDLLGGAN